MTNNVQYIPVSQSITDESGSAITLLNITASNAQNARNANSASNARTSSYAHNASYAANAQNSVYAQMAIEATTAGYADNTTFAQTASYASYASNCAKAGKCVTSSFSLWGEYADTASLAIEAITSINSTNSTYAQTASYVENAKNASTATTAEYSNDGWFAKYSDHANTAISASFLKPSSNGVALSGDSGFLNAQRTDNGRNAVGINLKDNNGVRLGGIVSDFENGTFIYTPNDCQKVVIANTSNGIADLECKNITASSVACPTFTSPFTVTYNKPETYNQVFTETLLDYDLNTDTGGGTVGTVTITSGQAPGNYRLDLEYNVPDNGYETTVNINVGGNIYTCAANSSVSVHENITTDSANYSITYTLQENCTFSMTSLTISEIIPAGITEAFKVDADGKVYVRGVEIGA